MRTPRLRSLGLALVLVLPACAWASEDDCELLADKIVELGKAEVPEVTDVGRAAADAMRPKMLEACIQRRPTKTQMACLLSATNKAEIEGC